MVNNSTNINKTIKQLSPQIIEHLKKKKKKKPWHMTLEIQVLALNRPKNMMVISF